MKYEGKKNFKKCACRVRISSTMSMLPDHTKITQKYVTVGYAQNRYLYKV